MDPMTIEQKRQALADLTAARALIRDISTWTQGAMARNKDGERIHPTSPAAVCFCGLGAIERVCWGPGPGPEPSDAADREQRAARRLAWALDRDTVTDRTDQLAHAEIDEDELEDYEREIVSETNDRHYDTDDTAEAREDHAAILTGYDTAIAALIEEIRA